MRRTVQFSLLAAAAGIAALVLGIPAGAWAQDSPPDPSHSEEDESSWQGPTNLAYGPFPMTSLSPFSSLRLGFAPRAPSFLPSGAFEARLGESWAKVLSLGNEWAIDYEVIRTSAAYSFGLSDHVRLDIDIEENERVRGTLDPLILGFHKAFELGFGDRMRYPPDALRFQVSTPGGTRMISEKGEPQSVAQAALLSLQHNVTYGDDWSPAISYALSLRSDLSRAGDLRGGGPVDLAASIALAKELPFGFHVYVGANVNWFGEEQFLGLPLRTFQWSWMGVLEWNLLPGFSLIGQYLLTNGAVPRLGAFALPSHEVTAGFKWEAAKGFLIELAVLENVINFDNSPDLGFHAGVTLRW